MVERRPGRLRTWSGSPFLICSVGLSAALLISSTSAFADETIVVTAERRARSIDELPANAAALSRDQLERIGAQAPSEALNRLPGVGIHRGSGSESLPAIRSPVLTGGQGAGSFLVLEDGVPIRAPGFANINQLFETSLDFADRVELTRGPGSALYGSNAVHGVVNVVTAASNPRDLYFRYDCDVAKARGPGWTSAAASVGSFGRYGAQATAQWGLDVNTSHCDLGAEIVQVRDTRRGSLSLSAKHEDGWRDDAGLDEQHGLLAFDSEVGGWTIEARLAAVNLQQETAGFVEGSEAYQDKALSKRNANPQAFRNSRLLRAHARIERNLTDALRAQITPFARTIDTDLLLHFFPSQALEETAQTGGGVQSALYWDPSETLALIGGVDLDVTRGSLRETQTIPTVGTYVQGLHYDYVVAATVLAAFAQTDWTFAPDWRLVAGVRAERSRYDYDNRAPDGDVGRFRRPADREDDFTSLTPKLGLVRTLDNGSAWLNLARGARAPQTSDLYSLQTTQAPGGQKAETIDSVELGWRNDWLEVALYTMDKRNSAFRNADGVTVTNGKTRHQGVEVSGAVPLTPTLDLSGWITYAEHTYRFADPVSRAGESIARGDAVDAAPNWLWNAQLRWRATPALETELAWTHMGAYFTNAANTRTYDGHDVFDLRASYDFAPVTLTVALRNLFDTRYAERADFAFGADRYFPGEPRAITLGLRARR